MTACKILVLGLLLTHVGNAAISYTPTGRGFSEEIELGTKETRKVDEALGKDRNFQDPFTVVFKCNRYKKNVASKVRELDCRASAALPEPVVKAPRR